MTGSFIIASRHPLFDWCQDTRYQKRAARPWYTRESEEPELGNASRETKYLLFHLDSKNKLIHLISRSIRQHQHINNHINHNIHILVDIPKNNNYTYIHIYIRYLPLWFCEIYLFNTLSLSSCVGMFEGSTCVVWWW